jgi:hypothetical protein
MKHDVMVHTELLKLDEPLFTNVVTKPSTLTSGRYTLEMQIAGKPATNCVLDLEFSNGRLTKISGFVQKVVQTGSIVSWEQYDMSESPTVKFVGVIDGDRMWGRVYVEPGQGWREGEPPEYGVWTARRVSDGTKPNLEPAGSGESGSNSSVNRPK